MGRCWWGLAGLYLLLAVGSAQAQDSTAAAPDSTRPWHQDAWTPIVTQEGVRIGYIFYSKADTRNNGVVLRLQNGNHYPVRYAFTIIFRGPKGKATARAEGTLQPGEMKTGEKDRLFWVPFKDGRRIGEVGLRGVEVTRLRTNGTPPRLGD